MYAVGGEVVGSAVPAPKVLEAVVLGSTGFVAIGFGTMAGAMPDGKTSPVVDGSAPVTPGICEVEAVGTILDVDRGASTFTGV